METLLQDIRYAARTLRKNPLFTAIAVTCLAVGIATNTTLFSCFNAIVLRPLPFPDADRLVVVRDRDVTRPGNTTAVSYLTFSDWKAQSRTLTGLAGTSGRSVAITEGEEPERLQATLVSASLFTTLGAETQIGRNFRDDEDQLGAPGAVILSDALWRRRYGGDSSVLHRVVSINNLQYAIIGVMPPRFRFPQNSDLWLPITPMLGNDRREFRSIIAYARLHAGTDVTAADKELGDIGKKLNEQYDPRSTFTGGVTSMRDQFVEPEVKQIVSTMFGAVTLVLLIACANVANLMLTRAAVRQREFALRAAIGAGRGRIVRQLVTESLLLAGLAGLIAIPLTWYGLHMIDGAIPPEQPLPWYFHWGVDRATLAYTAIVAAMTSLVFGLVPALQVSRGNLFDALKEGGRANLGSARRNKLRSALVIAEVALSLVLLVGASLFTRSFFALQSAQLGYDTKPIMTMRFYLPGTRYDSAGAVAGRVQDILQRVEGIAGVEKATVSNLIPMGSGMNGARVIVEGQPIVESGHEPIVSWTGVSGHWFDALNVKLALGRNFSDAEATTRTPVAVINQRMATRFWPKGDALGHRFRFTFDSVTSYEVIGVVPDIRTQQLDETGETPLTAFLPYRFLAARNNGLLVRTRGNPVTIVGAVREAVRASDPTIPVFSVSSMDKVRTLSFWQYGLFSAMFGTFGVIALILAGIGVYGVISYGVSQRTQEFGVRVALGARRRDVFGMVLREALWLAGIGVGIGVVGAFGVSRVVANLIIGVSPNDPLSFIAVAAFLTGIALLASYLPARRATFVDPLTALRAE